MSRRVTLSCSSMQAYRARERKSGWPNTVDAQATLTLSLFPMSTVITSAVQAYFIECSTCPSTSRRATECHPPSKEAAPPRGHVQVAKPRTRPATIAPFMTAGLVRHCMRRPERAGAVEFNSGTGHGGQAVARCIQEEGETSAARCVACGDWFPTSIRDKDPKCPHERSPGLGSGGETMCKVDFWKR